MATGEAYGPAIDEIRQAFGAGKSALGEELLASALEAGVPWDVVTRAVAEGVTRHYSTPPPRSQPGSHQILLA